MKSLICGSIAACIMGVFLFGCESEPLATDGKTAGQGSIAGRPVPPDTTPPPPPPDAHPAFVFSQSVWKQTGINKKKQPIGGYFHAITVIDEDGSDRTHVYYPPETSTRPFTSNATWNAAGTKVSFIEGDTPADYLLSKLVTIDITVVGGVPTAGNKQVLVTRNPIDSMTIIAQAWNPDPNNNIIAYLVRTPTEYAIYTIPATGGTPEKIHSIPSQLGSAAGSMSWDRTGTRIAYVGGTAGLCITIIDAETGTVQSTQALGLYSAIMELDWSQGGADYICYSARQSGSVNDVYMIGTNPGDVPVLLAQGGQRFTSLGLLWYSDMREPRVSPDGSRVVYVRMARDRLDYGSYTPAAFTDFVVDVATLQSTDQLYTGHGDWKQP